LKSELSQKIEASKGMIEDKLLKRKQRAETEIAYQFMLPYSLQFLDGQNEYKQ